jgi:hypothetical protein
LAQPIRDAAALSAVGTCLSGQSWQTRPPVRCHPSLQRSKREACGVGDGSKLSAILKMRLKKSEAFERTLPFSERQRCERLHRDRIRQITPQNLRQIIPQTTGQIIAKLESFAYESRALFPDK